MKRAIILGGTGAIGTATAGVLVDNGWQVEVTGRDVGHMPQTLREQGVEFHALDRQDTAGFGQLIGTGADLLVDLVAYSESDIAALLPMWVDAEAVVVASSRAVYIDAQGRHINSEQPPEFPRPIPESNPTLPPAASGTDPFTREGYGPSKAAMEQAALASGLPVTVLRPSKVHGPWARNARTRNIAEQMTAGARRIRIADRGVAVDHLSAAANIAELIHTVALQPGARTLNAADPDPLPAAEIFESIAEALHWEGEFELLEPGVPGGEHPWNRPHPVVLDTTSSLSLGYRPVGIARELIKDEARWVADQLTG